MALFGQIFFARQRINAEGSNSLAPAAPASRKSGSVWMRPSGPSTISRWVIVAEPLAYRQCHFLARVTMLRQAHSCSHARIHLSSGRHAYIFDLHVVRALFFPKADGVHRQAAIAQSLQRVEPNARAP